MANSFILRIVLAVVFVKTFAVQYDCQRNYMYQQMGVCVLDDIIQLIPNTTHLEIRNGFVPEVWFRLPLIETLQLLYTNLTTLDALPGTNFSLKQLTVRSPVFSSWSTSLTLLEALEKIDISYCNFSYISLEWFISYENLQVLDVSRNKLISVDSPPGLRLAALQEFCVYGNKLEFLQQFPDAFPQVKLIDLADNMWHCDWMTKVREAMQGMIAMSEDLFCEEDWNNIGGLCCQPKCVVEKTNCSEIVPPEESSNRVVREKERSDKGFIIEVRVIDLDNSIVALNESLAYNVSSYL